MKLMAKFFLIFIPILLMGCSHFTAPAALQLKDKRYLQARSIAPLRIPPGVSSSAFRNDYPVSDAYYSESAKEVNLTPPGL